MSDSNVRALQYTLNRYAPIAGFASISTDGIMGQLTGQAVLKSLAWVTSNDVDEADPAGQLVATLVNNDGSTNLAQMATSAQGLNIFLGQIADAMRVSAGQPVVAATSTGPSLPNLPGPKTPQNVGANLLASIKSMPTWAKVAGGVVFGVGIIAGHSYMKKRHGGLSGFFGLS